MRKPIALALLLCPLLFLAMGEEPAWSQKNAGSVRNPHGPMAIPCEDCHTTTSWKPIRAVPEFNHDHTRYPLRGMHSKVACTDCHSDLEFKNVGMNCADCH